MGLTEDFIARYRKEFDFYDQAGRLVAQTLEVSLQAAGVRSIVTSRAKSVTRLEAKVRQRAATRAYASVDDIYADIVDLAGVRVALYFPGERDQVDTVVRGLFAVVGTPKTFPTGAQASYKKRFSGYWATHYRVQMRDVTLSDAQKRYAEARVEVQVASVVMHAWAEVEHDLVYKPLQGALSDDEYAILDELNGLVMAGEIALERLQRAGEARVAAAGRQFSNHFDLAAHLLRRTASILKGPLGDTALGRVDLLFEMLSRLNKATPDAIESYLVALHADTERRPIAEQIIDQLLAEDDGRYKVYEDVRLARLAASTGPVDVQPAEPDVHEAMGYFLSAWIAFERRLRPMMQSISSESRVAMPTGRVLERLQLFEPDTRAEVDRIRRLRNSLVHGVEIPDPADIREAADRLQKITALLPPESEPLP